MSKKFLQKTSGKRTDTPIPAPTTPGPETENITAAAAAQAEIQGSHNDPEQTTQNCPVPIKVIVTTRVGNIPINNARIEIDNTFWKNTTETGIASGKVSMCGGIAYFKIIYQNNTKRLKREEFTISVNNLDIAAGTVTASQASNFISKIQDVFGMGSSQLPGDQNFIDHYPGDELAIIKTPEGTSTPHLIITAKMATLALNVPYVNQNNGSEKINNTVHRGNVLCMPTSGEMLAGYWNIQHVSKGTDDTETRTPLTRLHIMQTAHTRNPRISLTKFPRAWQRWDLYRQTMQALVDASTSDTYRVHQGATGGNNAYSIPSDYADGIRALIAKGIPTITSTVATTYGHVMVATGAVVSHDNQTAWLIFNDPYGTLSSPDSIYGNLNIQAAVGAQRNNDAANINQPDDVLAVQMVLKKLGYYQGSPGAAVNPANTQDQTIQAILRYQGNRGDGRIDPDNTTERRLNEAINQNTSSSYSNAEQEINQASGDKGRHVYYNGETEGADNDKFRIKGAVWSCVIEPKTALTKTQLKARIVPSEVMQE